MGLDMYLVKKSFVGANFERRDITVDIEVEGKSITVDFKKLKNLCCDNRLLNVEFDKISYIQTEVGYWRKANAIHKWFVTNVQNGVDDCGEYYASKEMLKELLVLCEAIIADKSKAPELLPATNGFFFGSNEYDEFYFRDVKYTIKTIINALNANNDYSSFYYRSSW